MRVPNLFLDLCGFVDVLFVGAKTHHARTNPPLCQVRFQVCFSRPLVIPQRNKLRIEFLDPTKKILAFAQHGVVHDGQGANNLEASSFAMHRIKTLKHENVLVARDNHHELFSKAARLGKIRQVTLVQQIKGSERQHAARNGL